MSLVTRTLKTLIPDNVRAYLAADSILAAFFGASRIQTREYPESGGPTPAPFLVVSQGPLTDRPTTSQSANAQLEIDVTAYLPRTLTADASISTPSAPTVAVGAAGALTVSRRYAVTFYNAGGESFASDLSAPLVLTAQKGTVTIPTGPAGTTGRGLWATKTGGLCPYFLDSVPGNALTTYADEILDADLGDEIAPYPGDYGDVFERVKAVLWAARTLERLVPTATGIQLVDSLASFKDARPTVDASRNQVVWTTTVTYSLFYSLGDRQSLIET